MKSTDQIIALNDKREALRLKLQNNREFLDHRLSVSNDTFPRSITMRLLAQSKIGNEISKKQWPQAGLDVIRLISQGFYIAALIKRNAKSH